MRPGRTGTGGRESVRRRWLGRVGIAGAGVAVVLLMLSSTALGTNVTPAYKGASWTPTTSTSTAGCSKASFPHAVSWDPTTGVGLLDVRTMSDNCANPLNGGTISSSYAVAELQVNVPGKLAHASQCSGTPAACTTFYVNWTFGLFTVHKLVDGACGSLTTGSTFGLCNNSVSVSILVDSFVTDLTNGSVVRTLTPYNASGIAYWTTTCTPTCTVASASSFPAWATASNSPITGTFLKAHKYDVGTTIEITARSTTEYSGGISAMAGSSATAAFNLGSASLVEVGYS
jgi:hypothetical protein